MGSTRSVTLAVGIFVLAVLAWDWRLLVLAVAVGAQWFFEPLYKAIVNAARPEAVVEAFFEDGSGDPQKRQPFPSLITMEKGEISLSVIFPAFREAKRLPQTMKDTLEYLTTRERRYAGFTWEIIIVDDGSPDDTYKVALGYTAKEGSNKVRVLKLARNHGKGGAVKKGMLRARGKLLLMADADGATRISDVERLEEAIQRYPNSEGLVFGSRAHMVQDEESRRKGIRGFVSMVFHSVFVGLGVPGHIRDTQCGFKLVSRAAARNIFPLQKFYGWAFDCELLFLARIKNRYPVSEVAVDWRDVEGSTLSVTDASLEMVRDIILMNIMYRTGLW